MQIRRGIAALLPVACLAFFTAQDGAIEKDVLAAVLAWLPGWAKFLIGLAFGLLLTAWGSALVQSRPDSGVSFYVLVLAAFSCFFLFLFMQKADHKVASLLLGVLVATGGYFVFRGLPFQVDRPASRRQKTDA